MKRFREEWALTTRSEKCLLLLTLAVWLIGIIGLLAVDLHRASVVADIVGASYLFGALAGIALLLMVGRNIVIRRNKK